MTASVSYCVYGYTSCRCASRQFVSLVRWVPTWNGKGTSLISIQIKLVQLIQNGKHNVVKTNNLELTCHVNNTVSYRNYRRALLDGHLANPNKHQFLLAGGK